MHYPNLKNKMVNTPLPDASCRAPYACLLMFLVLFFSQVSCTTSRRSAVSCPEFSFKKNSYIGHYKSSVTWSLLAHKNIKTRNISRLKKHQFNQISNKKSISRASSTYENIDFKNVDYTKGMMASTDNIIYPVMNNVASPLILMDPGYSQPAIYDTVVMKSTAVFIGKVEETGQSGLYDTNFPDSAQSDNIKALRTEGLGVAGFMSGMVGLFKTSFPLGIMALILGGISLAKIRNNPDRYKGKGFAIASIILGFIDVIANFLIFSIIY